MVQANINDASSRDILLAVGEQLGKDMSSVIETLESNFVLNAEDLAKLTKDEFKELNVPIGLINRIQHELASRSPNPAAFVQNAQLVSR